MPSSKEVGRRVELGSNSRAKAIAYLESIPLDFLRQLEKSVKALNMIESRPNRTTKPKPKRNGSSPDTEHGTVNSKAEGSDLDWSDVGITMELKNRQTGYDQDTI